MSYNPTVTDGTDEHGKEIGIIYQHVNEAHPDVQSHINHVEADRDKFKRLLAEAIDAHGCPWCGKNSETSHLRTCEVGKALEAND